jgi:hypothetical protein
LPHEGPVTNGIPGLESLWHRSFSGRAVWSNKGSTLNDEERNDPTWFLRALLEVHTRAGTLGLVSDDAQVTKAPHEVHRVLGVPGDESAYCGSGELQGCVALLEARGRAPFQNAGSGGGRYIPEQKAHGSYAPEEHADCGALHPMLKPVTFQT